MAGYKVFVGGIPDEASDADLFDYFSQFGELSDYVVMKNRGFGFVTFIHKESEEACLTNSRHLLLGKEVEVKRPSPRVGGVQGPVGELRPILVLTPS